MERATWPWVKPEVLQSNNQVPLPSRMAEPSLFLLLLHLFLLLFFSAHYPPFLKRTWHYTLHRLPLLSMITLHSSSVWTNLIPLESAFWLNSCLKPRRKTKRGLLLSSQLLSVFSFFFKKKLDMFYLLLKIQFFSCKVTERRKILFQFFRKLCY